MYSSLIGVELATSSAAEVSLSCAWHPTIHSQGSQSFTQFVDFSGAFLSLMPPGNSSAMTLMGYLAELGNWEQGALKAAPMPLWELRAIAVDVEDLSHTP